jgi:hypothetical protein
MRQKLQALQKLAVDLKSQGFAQEASRVSKLLIKKALNIDVDFLNQVRDQLGDSVSEMEYYPPGAGLFPEKQEVGIFFQEFELEKELREQLKELGFDFKALVTNDFFEGTISGSTSKAAQSLEGPYFVIVVTMEEKV